MIPNLSGLFETVEGAIELENLAIVTVNAFGDPHVDLLVEGAVEIRLVDIGLMIEEVVSSGECEENADRNELGNGYESLTKVYSRPLQEALCDESNLVPQDATVLVLLATENETTSDDLCVPRELVSIDRVEDLVLVTEGGELVVFSRAPSITVRVLHRFAMVSRIRRRKCEVVLCGLELGSC